jgi:hypothetical protein
MAARVVRLDQAIAAVPDKIEGDKPVTLGIGEPFTMTLAVSGMFALILALPLILYQLYAFVIPALSPPERRTAVPLISMVPVLFAFGYFLMLPAAVRFLPNFNTDEFKTSLSRPATTTSSSRCPCWPQASSSRSPSASSPSPDWASSPSSSCAATAATRSSPAPSRRWSATDDAGM